MWTCRLFKHTGFNGVNTADNGRRLDSAEYIDVEPLNLLQGEHLSEVRVKANRGQVKDVDFLQLTDTVSGDKFYYAVDPFMMTSGDVSTLYVTIDPVLTAAGIVGNIKDVEFGDGITDRYHVKKSDDIFGAYTEDDPLLVPDEPLEYSASEFFNTTTYTDSIQLVESTMSLNNMAARREAITYTDSGDGGTVVVPQTVAAQERTRVQAFNGAYDTPGTEYYDQSKQVVQDGIARVRSLGCEGSILNSWVLPSDCADPGVIDDEDGIVHVLYGTNDEVDTYIDLDYVVEEANKRLTYGSMNMVELISTCEGTSLSFKPEDIAESKENPGTVIIQRFTDPRPHGRPWYRTKYYKYDLQYTWANLLPGKEWANAPLVYTGVSGSYLNQIQYNSQRQYDAAMIDVTREGMARGHTGDLIAGMTGLAKTGMSEYMSNNAPINPVTTIDDNGGIALWKEMTAMNSAQTARMRDWSTMGNLIGMGIGMIGTAGQLATGTDPYTIQHDQLLARYGAQVRSELQQFALKNYVVKPELNFPNNESLRDFVGNGLYVVKYSPTQKDLQKMNKILTMYGYKVTDTLTGDLFNTRSKFNFVATKGVTVTDKRLPMWLREALASRLNAGVRVWHQLPDVKAYTDHSNV